jgi:hypothetical protein
MSEALYELLYLISSIIDVIFKLSLIYFIKMYIDVRRIKQ